MFGCVCVCHSGLGELCDAATLYFEIKLDLETTLPACLHILSCASLYLHVFVWFSVFLYGS